MFLMRIVCGVLSETGLTKANGRLPFRCRILALPSIDNMTVHLQCDQIQAIYVF